MPASGHRVCDEVQGFAGSNCVIVQNYLHTPEAAAVSLRSQSH